MESLLAYLDTCIVSGLAKGDLAQADIEALLKVLQRHKDRAVSLVTSRVTKEEIDCIPRKYHLLHEVIYNLLVDLPVVKAFRTDSGLMLMGVGRGIRLHPMLAKRITLLTDEADARHLYQAARNGVRYLITTDARTIVSRKAEIEEISDVLAVRPTEFLSIPEDVELQNA
jgi:hypothetical protein